MYEKLTKRLEKVIRLARTNARKAEREYVGTEHVLLAVRQEGTGIGAKLLDRFGVDEHRLKGELDKHARQSMEATWVFGRLPGSPHLKSAIGSAIELARQLNSKEVCTEHLLLAMLKEKGSIAEQALRTFGVTYKKARDETRKIVAGE